jgi:curved DNA-binding protein
VYTNEEYDLQTTITIRLSDSLLGTQVGVPTIDGGELNLKIPPGTRHKTRMRLPGHGLPRMKGETKGDLYVIVSVNIPKQLTEEQKKLVEALAEAGL